MFNSQFHLCVINPAITVMQPCAVLFRLNGGVLQIRFFYGVSDIEQRMVVDVACQFIRVELVRNLFCLTHHIFADGTCRGAIVTDGAFDFFVRLIRILFTIVVDAVSEVRALGYRMVGSRTQIRKQNPNIPALFVQRDLSIRMLRLRMIDRVGEIFFSSNSASRKLIA